MFREYEHNNWAIIFQVLIPIIYWLFLTGCLALGHLLNLTKLPILTPNPHHYKMNLIPSIPFDCSELNGSSHQNGTSTGSSLEYMICELGLWFYFPKKMAGTCISLFPSEIQTILSSQTHSETSLRLGYWVCSSDILDWLLCLLPPSLFCKIPPRPILPKCRIMALGPGPYFLLFL